MKRPVEWTNEPELLNDIYEALASTDIEDTCIEHVSSRVDERNEYGEVGYLTIITKDGRKFSLNLYEETF